MTLAREWIDSRRAAHPMPAWITTYEPLGDIIAKADAFTDDACVWFFWPTQPVLVIRHLLFIAGALGTDAARGLALDDAYKAMRGWCEHASGAVPVADSFPDCAAEIDRFAANVAPRLEAAAIEAFGVLRDVALAALNSDLPDRAVRAAVGNAAKAMQPIPDISIIANSYQDAITEARRNSKWMSRRSGQAA